MSGGDEGHAQGTWYVRVLRLRHVCPGGLVSFLLFECVVALAVLLALAELVSWWAVPVLPLAVAVMVKVNDVVAGAMGRPDTTVPAARTQPDADESTTDAGLSPLVEAGIVAAEPSVVAEPVPVAVAPAAPGRPRTSRVYRSGSRVDDETAVPATAGRHETGNVYGSPTQQPDHSPVQSPALADAPVGHRLADAARRAGVEEPGDVGARVERGGGRHGHARTSVPGRHQTTPAVEQRGRVRREPTVDPELERELARPEWRQTVTLGRHANRDDARRAAQANLAQAEMTRTDDGQARHRAVGAPGNQRRFA